MKKVSMTEFQRRRFSLATLVWVSFLSAFTAPSRGAGPGPSAVKYPYPGQVKPDLWLLAGQCNLKGMVWYQGESDAIEFPSDSKLYQQNLVKFVDHVRKDTGNPRLPFIHVQISRVVPNVVPGVPGKSQGGEIMDDAFETYSRAWETVREAQRQLADKRDHVYMVSTIDLYPLSDPIHLDFEAYQRLGPRLAKVALSQVYQLPGHATPIKLESTQLADTLDHHTHKPIQGVCTVRVRYRGVNGKLQAKGAPCGFEMRFPELTREKAKATVPVIYRVDFDPTDPAAVLLRSTGAMATLLSMNPVLYYGGGMNPYCNITDDKDISIHAFGPVKVLR